MFIASSHPEGAEPGIPLALRPGEWLPHNLADILEGIEWRPKPPEDDDETGSAEDLPPDETGSTDGSGGGDWMATWLSRRGETIVHHGPISPWEREFEVRGDWDEFSPEESGHVRQTNITLVVDPQDSRNLGHHDYYDHHESGHDHHHH